MRTFWFCEDCAWSCEGDERAAHEHHHEEFGHWLFEVTLEETGRRGVTGRTIHTSDGGGFYLDDLGSEMVCEAAVLKRIINPVLRAA